MAWVRPVGELDMATIADLDAQLARLLEGGSRRIVLDLRGLRFVDSSGLHLILRYDAEAKRAGFSLQLMRGVPAVHRVFDLMGITSRLSFVDA